MNIAQQSCCSLGAASTRLVQLCLALAGQHGRPEMPLEQADAMGCQCGLL